MESITKDALPSISPLKLPKMIECVKKMPHPSGTPLAGRHISETDAWIGCFFVDLASAFALQFK